MAAPKCLTALVRKYDLLLRITATRYEIISVPKRDTKLANIGDIKEGDWGYLLFQLDAWRDSLSGGKLVYSVHDWFDSAVVPSFKPLRETCTHIDNALSIYTPDELNLAVSGYIVLLTPNNQHYEPA
jgi:hypothetical protein